MGREEYGLEILRVQEIKGYSGITPIPNTPPEIKGVMNLRGTVVPVLDLRVKFSMETREYDKFTVIILVTVGEKIVGLVVDAVSDVLDIPAGRCGRHPTWGARRHAIYHRHGHVAEKLVVLVDVRNLWPKTS